MPLLILKTNNNLSIMIWPSLFTSITLHILKPNVIIIEIKYITNILDGDTIYSFLVYIHPKKISFHHYIHLCILM